MCRVQSQLMRTTRNRAEKNTCAAILHAYDLILGYGLLAIGCNHLTGTVVIIKTHRQIYRATLVRHLALQKCHITFFDRATNKLRLQCIMHLLALGEN